MKDEEMLYCLIAFILGWLASRHMGNGFSVGGSEAAPRCPDNPVPNGGSCESINYLYDGASTCGRWYGKENGNYYTCEDAHSWEPFKVCKSSGNLCDPNADPFADFHSDRK